MTINFIQDIATPHNNVLLNALNQDKNIDLNIWYCYDRHPQYDWDEDLTNEIKKAKIYKSNKIDWKFLQYCLKNQNEKFFVVGWMNPTTKLLIILFWLLRRPLNMWFDYPNNDSKRSIIKHYFREVYYLILKSSKIKVFGVGKMTIEYFIKRGFSNNILVNLPIFVDVDKTKKDYIKQRSDISKKYNILEDDLFLSAGSRLIYDKGYDILITAINNLDENIKKNIKCVIIGKGEEKENLENLIDLYKLQNSIFIEEWLEMDEFKALIANSDIFIHPSRFDAYGGTIFAMSVGTPVVGSIHAGAAYDRIENNKNGFLYNGEQKELSKKLEEIFDNKDDLEDLSNESLNTAKRWKPCFGVSIIKENTI